MRGDNYNIDTKHFIIYQLIWIRSYMGNVVKDFFGWLFSSSLKRRDFIVP